MKLSRKKILFVAAVFLLIISIGITIVNLQCNVFITTYVQSNNSDITEKINNIIKQHVENNGFSGTVLVAKGDKILFNEGYGYAKRYFGRKQNTAGTKYLLGSITKTFTALAITKLEEKKMLSFDDKVTKYFPDYKKWDDITIHNLLNHSSGIPNYYQSPFDYIKYFAFHKTPEQILSVYQNTDLQFKPGTEFKYSNTNYIALARIIEKVSGLSYIDFLDKNILGPLEMTSTGYEEKPNLVDNLARGYLLNMIVEVDGFNLSNLFGAGGLYSSTEDLFNFARALDQNKMVNDKTQIPTSEINPDATCYGYGLVFDNNKDYGKAYFHTGGGPGISTAMFKLTDKDIIMIVLSNNQLYPTENLIKDLADLF